MLFEPMCWVFADANVKALSGRTPQYVDEIWLSADSRHVTQMKRAQVRFSALSPWLRGLDLNQRPSGYEPDELPDCSTPRSHDSGSGVVRQTRHTVPATLKINCAKHVPALQISRASEFFPGGLVDFLG